MAFGGKGGGLRSGIDICCSTTDVFVSQVHSVEANRNGMSLTGVSNLTVLDSSFKFTSGTCCMSGLDLEPEITSEVTTGR